jgi:hypothetical protein
MPKFKSEKGKHRARLRAAGLRPVPALVAARRRGFRAACRRESLMLQNDPQEADVLERRDGDQPCLHRASHFEKSLSQYGHGPDSSARELF